MDVRHVLVIVNTFVINKTGRRGDAVSTYTLEGRCVREADVTSAARRVVGRVPVVVPQVLRRLETSPTSLALVMNSLVLHMSEHTAQMRCFALVYLHHVCIRRAPDPAYIALRVLGGKVIMLLHIEAVLVADRASDGRVKKPCRGLRR